MVRRVDIKRFDKKLKQMKGENDVN